MSNNVGNGWKQPGWKLTILLAAIALITSLFIPAVQDWLKSIIQSAPTTSTSAPTTRPPPLSTPQPTGIESSPSQSTTIQPPSGVQYLSDMEQISGTGEPGSSTLGTGAAKRDYPNSLKLSINTFGTDRKDMEYKVPTGARTFTATVGIDGSAPPGNVVTFQIYLNGDSVWTGQSLQGWATEKPTISVVGKDYIKLSVLFAKGAATGFSGYAVWGDAQFAK